MLLGIKQFGAIGDGSTDETKAIQAALDAAGRRGGGTVIVPAGQYLTGAIQIPSRTTLHVDAGATLLGSSDAALYRGGVLGEWAMRPLIGAEDAEDIALEGRGTIDGCGQPWWDKLWDWRRAGGKTIDPGKKPQGMPDRPRIVFFHNCRNVRISGLTLRNSPVWTVHLQRCTEVVMDSLRLFNPDYAINSDGLNSVSCRNVRISGCFVSVGDDGITLKSGMEEENMPPCENVTITNCVVERGHGGVVVGCEMSGGVRNIAVSNCVSDGTYRGIRVKTRRGRGGVVEHLLASNIVMRNVPFPILFDPHYYDFDADRFDARPHGPGSPLIRHVHLQNIDAYGARKAAQIVGLRESFWEDFTLDGVRVQAKRGIMARCVRGLRLTNMDIRVTEGSPLTGELLEGLRHDDTIAASAGTLELEEGQYTIPLHKLDAQGVKA
jgi:polygalacturonase